MTESGATDNFKSADHALISGMVWGLLMKHGINAWPVIDDHNNYTDVIKIEEDEYEFSIRVVLDDE